MALSNLYHHIIIIIIIIIITTTSRIVFSYLRNVLFLHDLTPTNSIVPYSISGTTGNFFQSE